MFPPFTSPSEFYPGLIIWCMDPYEFTAGPTRSVDPSKRDQRPCLVVAVNAEQRLIQVARFCETQPIDTRLWVRVDTAPEIRWKHSDAWIWVGPPATLRMVFDRAKYMHAHRDTSYTTTPVCTQNIEAYWIHRRRFLANNGIRFIYWYVNNETYGTGTPSSSPASSRSPSTMPPSPTFSPFSPLSSAYPSRATTPIETVNPWLPRAGVPQDPAQYLAPDRSPYAHAYTPSAVYPREGESQSQNSSRHHRSTPSSSVSGRHSLVPTGFIKTEKRAWFKNPESGWFWHAARGLVAPDSPYLPQDMEDS
ncbi:hypothetical protein C8F01DRAFT_1232076 [Mycena amicta]|nr:hypothetical protein C8F01DRAFT_1232076 [Mycena amicta]